MPTVSGDHPRWAGMLGAQVASPRVRPRWVALNFREPAMSMGGRPALAGRIDALPAHPRGVTAVRPADAPS